MCTIAAFSAHERRFMANYNFIMLPTVDFCFNNLMQNSKVRRGFIAALLKVSPSEIEDTCILPTLLPRDAPDDKLGILDFIHFPGDSRCYRSFHFRDDRTGSLYTDKMELQILELKKLPADMHTEEDIIAWMKFFNGKDRKEFERMAKTNEYLDEAYHTLVNLSADEQKRLEYEAREKALKDYNTQISSAEKRGVQIGQQAGEQRARQVFKLHIQGKSLDEIAEYCDLTVEKVKEILE